jgi:hypothetical protein
MIGELELEIIMSFHFLAYRLTKLALHSTEMGDGFIFSIELLQICLRFFESPYLISGDEGDWYTSILNSQRRIGQRAKLEVYGYSYC